MPIARAFWTAGLSVGEEDRLLTVVYTTVLIICPLFLQIIVTAQMKILPEISWNKEDEDGQEREAFVRRTVGVISRLACHLCLKCTRQQELWP